MQFEHPAYSSPFYPPGYGYTSPPPGGMPPRANFYEGGFGASIPTPAPSPRTPSASRRRTQDFSGGVSAEYVHHKRPSSSRRSGHEHSEFPHEQYHASTSSPRPGAGHRAAYMNPTPLHTPPPSAHAHHSSGSGTMPNIYSYVPGFTAQQAEYVSPSSFPSEDYRGGSSSRHRTRPSKSGRRRPRSYYYTYSSSRPVTDSYPSRSQFPQQSYTPGPQSPPPTRDSDGRRSRTTRRQSTWQAGEPTPRSPPQQSKPKFTRSQTEPASTDAEAVRRKAAEHGIPQDYSLKNWDPEERPIILLGSVFDANSLGEWIFNWTKYHHGKTHDATKTAGGLWELLTELSSKLKRAREFFGYIKAPENREILDDFMESGERLWQKLKSLLRNCEDYMWRGARGVASPGPQDKPAVQMGKRSGAEFVDAMFNGEKEWERTERLMRGMATWCQRFEVNCEDILRSPNA
ncbi:uncharacterized protein H6S33_004587 [Morchella sextelata]|uniref:uncharacterized protein n=1 Tax=Morchella sextelata TaxID=1174677 RepID=UPI001D03D585|nr:uncharacterized protein H6S33_004587 [Morchella sextelata]KAH0605365.1 hypothetical protein H6S33_004587 [Morchella sextelata]